MIDETFLGTRVGAEPRFDVALATRFDASSVVPKPPRRIPGLPIFEIDHSLPVVDGLDQEDWLRKPPTVERKDYREDQVRDDHGRFGEGTIPHQELGKNLLAEHDALRATIKVEHKSTLASDFEYREKTIAQSREELKTETDPRYIDDLHHVIATAEAAMVRDRPKYEREMRESTSDEALKALYEKRGLGEIHHAILDGWIASATSKGASTLHAALAINGVPGSMKDDSERMERARYEMRMTGKSAERDAFLAKGAIGEAKVKEADQLYAHHLNELTAAMTKHNIPFEGDPLPPEKIPPEVQRASDSVGASLGALDRVRRETEEDRSNADMAREFKHDPTYGAKVQKYLELNYAITQAALERDFPGKKEFTVYRGVHDAPAAAAQAHFAARGDAEPVRVPARPASSWTDARGVAANFARVGETQTGAILAMKVPKESIIDYYGLHRNMASENEMVVAGAEAMRPVVSQAWTRDDQYVERKDYSEDQPRDDHGRFGSGGLGLAKDTGAGSERAGAKDMGQLAEQLKNLHSGTKDSQGKEIRDDWGVSVFERERFATPARTAVLEHFKDIVENATGIKQTIPIQELRIDKLNGANGTMTPAHVETIRNYDRDENDNALPDHVMQMASRITVTPDQHVAAIAALEALGQNKVPTHEQIGGLHTYIHEMCHTTSPMQLAGAKSPDGTPYPSAYRAHGAVIEEVTTEVMARGVMAKLLAFNEERGYIMSPHSQIIENRAGARSSYQPAINWTLDKIKEATINATPHGVGLGEAGIERGRAVVALREATQAYRAMRPPTPFSKDQAAAQFANHIGHAVVKAHPDAEIHAGEVAEAVRLQLRQIDGGPDSDILQRFDAETMTRFDAAQSVWTVPRNDIEAAMAISNPSPDEMGVLLMLQDNPDLLLQALAKRSP